MLTQAYEFQRNCRSAVADAQANPDSTDQFPRSTTHFVKFPQDHAKPVKENL